MSMYFIRKVKTGYNFNLVSDNAKSVGSSQVYKSLESAKAGCKSVKNAAPKANIEDKTAKVVVEMKKPKFEIYNDKQGNFRFRLIATNGENIFASQGYTRKDNCKRGINSVLDICGSEVVVDDSIKK